MIVTVTFKTEKGQESLQSILLNALSKPYGSLYAHRATNHSLTYHEFNSFLLTVIAR